MPLKEGELRKKTITISVVHVIWKEDDKKVSGKRLKTPPPQTDSSVEIDRWPPSGVKIR